MARLLYFNCGNCACIEVAGQPRDTFVLVKEIAKMEIKKLKILGDINYIEARELAEEISTNPRFVETYRAFAERYLAARRIPIAALDGVQTMFISHRHELAAPMAQA